MVGRTFIALRRRLAVLAAAILVAAGATFSAPAMMEALEVPCASFLTFRTS